MALPPIITNNPIIKLFQTGQKNNASAKESAQTEVKGASPPQDIVELSEAARQKLESAQVGPLETDQEARHAAKQARDFLAAEETRTLGLDPGFAA